MVWILIVLVAILIAGLVAFSGWLTMWAWGIVLVPLLHWPAITFWQAVGVNVLLTVIGRVFRGIATRK